MSFQRTTVALVVLAGLASFPAAAMAAPPPHDHFLDAAFINDPGTPLPKYPAQEIRDNTTTTAEATVQTSDMFAPPSSGGPPEPTSCHFPPDSNFPSGRVSVFGKTVWYAFFPDVDGVVQIRAAGFDAVLGFFSFADPQALPGGSALLADYACFDDPSLVGNEEVFLSVRRGRGYAIQLGGYSPSGTPSGAAGGPVELLVRFFPDTDGDTILDGIDECSTEPGSSRHGGCPDTDGDDVRDRDDQCRTLPGLRDLGGCPDGDGDRVPNDGRDACPNENSRVGQGGDSDGNGCRNLFRFALGTPNSYDNWQRRVRGRFRLVGIKLKRLDASTEQGARVVVNCSSRRGGCRRVAKTVGASGKVRLLGKRNLRSGITITVRATLDGAVGRYVRWKVGRGALNKTAERCLRPGSSRPERCNAISLVR